MSTSAVVAPGSPSLQSSVAPEMSYTLDPAATDAPSRCAFGTFAPSFQIRFVNDYELLTAWRAPPAFLRPSRPWRVPGSHRPRRFPSLWSTSSGSLPWNGSLDCAGELPEKVSAVEPRIGSASEGCRCPGHGIPRGRHCRGPASCRDRPSVAHTLGPTRSRPSSGSRPRMVSARVPASASGPRRLLVSSRRRVHPPVVLVQPVDLPPAVQEDEAEVVIAPGRERLPKTLEVDGREELWPSRRPRRPSRRS